MNQNDVKRLQKQIEDLRMRIIAMNEEVVRHVERRPSIEEKQSGQAMRQWLEDGDRLHLQLGDLTRESRALEREMAQAIAAFGRRIRQRRAPQQNSDGLGETETA